MSEPVHNTYAEGCSQRIARAWTVGARCEVCDAAWQQAAQTPARLKVQTARQPRERTAMSHEDRQTHYGDDRTVSPGEDGYADAFDLCPEVTCPLYMKAVMADHAHLPDAKPRQPTVEHRLRVSGDVEVGHDEDGQPWMRQSAFTLVCLSDGSVRWER